MAEEVEVKISTKRIVFSIAVIAVAAALYLSYPYITYQLFPITKYNYHGTELDFRSDLKEAQKIPVYPNERLVVDTLFSPFVTNLTIAFQDTSQNDFVAVEAYGIAYKMRTAYLATNHNVNITSYATNSSVYGTADNPVIILVPPVLAGETAVRVSNFTITISAKTLKEFDLATDKFLMVAMGIKV